MISVVVTCYNSENTIERTLESLLNNTYKDLEIIVVNDCSTDNSMSVVKSIKDDRIKIVEHSINLGAGFARDTGVKNSTGDYISFVDSDDWVSNDFYEVLLKCSNENNSDITYAKLIPLVDGVEQEPFYHDNGPFEGVDRITHTLLTNGIYFLNNGIFKKHLFDNVEYNHSRLIEDTPTMLQLHYYANKIVYTNEGAYYYPQNSNSLIHGASTKKKQLYRLLAMINSYHFFKDKKDFNEIFTYKSVLTEICRLAKHDPEKECQKLYPDEFKQLIDFVKKK